MNMNHFTNSIKQFSAKMSALRTLTVIPFLCFIGAEILDIQTIHQQIADYQLLLKKEQSTIEKNLSNMITVGDHCARSTRRYQINPIKSLRNIFNIMDEYSFATDEQWKSNIKLLSKLVKQNYSHQHEAFRDYKKLINISSKSIPLKRYTTAKLKEEIASRAYTHCIGTFGCGFGRTLINPIIKKKGNKLELYTYHWDYTSIRPIYSVNGGNYDREFLFIPTQSGIHYLDVVEKYVQRMEIKTQRHCVEVVVE